jgi:hypothetical protein
MQRFILLLGVLCLLLVPLGVQAQTPPTPENLVAHVNPWSTPSVELSWQVLLTPTMGELFFRINRSTDDSTHFEVIGVANQKSFRDWHVTAGHTYYYTVNSLIFHDSTVLQSPPSNIAWASIGPPTHRPRGEISGTVTDSVTGKPIPFVGILFYREATGLHAVMQTWTDLSGKYRAVLDTGTYLIKAQPTIVMPMSLFPISLYLPEWYKDAPDAAHATPVPVADSSQFTANIDLERVKPPVPATISGTVTDSSGNPLKGALVTFMRSFSEMPLLDANGVNFPGMGDENIDIDDIGRLCGIFGKAWTDSLGKYTAHVLAGRSYVAMAVKRGYLPQFFDHKQDPRDADIIHLGGDTSGIDFALIPRPVEANSISGMVRDSTGMGVPSRIVLIPLLRPSNVRWNIRFGSTDSLGDYTISHVRAGRYFVMAIPLSDYAPAFYKAGAYGVLRWKDADTVSIVGAVTGIDIGVVRIHGDGPSTLAGMVASEGVPVSGVNVFATDAQGRVEGYGFTDANGAYSITGLPTGQVTIVADRDGYNPAQGSVYIGPADYSVNGGSLNLTAVAVTSVPGQMGVPSSYALEQNYPNPFNPSTAISYGLSAVSQVTLKVFNVLGQEVAVLVNETKAPGRYTVNWDAAKFASGVYLYTISATPVSGGQAFSSLKKMVLLK